jgi:mannose-1-phosphate guanylyltransferase/mannose-6-phosphate isomerase
MACELFSCLAQLGLDPSAPRLLARVQGGLNSQSGGPRRCAGIELPDHARRVVVVDDAAFTGNTLLTVRDALARKPGKVDVSFAVLAAGSRLLNDRPDLGLDLHYFVKRVSGDSVSFPYHRVHPTAPFLSWSNGECQAAIRQLARQLVENDSVPDCLVAVYDPDAPGGVTVLEDLTRCLAQLYPGISIETGRIRIQGGRTRVEREQARLGAGRRRSRDIRIPGAPRRILVVDDVSFTGNTLVIARDSIRQILPEAEVSFAVLAAGRQLLDNLQTLGLKLEYYYRPALGDHVNFPWSRVGPTGTLPGYRAEPDRLHRPWGYMDIFVKEHVCSVRLLTFEAGQRMSLQRHKRRDELLVAIDDGLTVQIAENAEQIQRGASAPTVARSGDQMFIPRDMWHRFGAPPDRSVRSLEIAFGAYDQEGDLERLEDDYGRPLEGDWPPGKT